MKKISSLIFFSIYSCLVHAQTIKSDVLVVGNDIAAVSAAIQAARSGVKTILMDAGPIGESFNQTELSLLKKNYKDTRRISKKDSLASTKPILLKNITDTISNLTLMVNTRWKSIEKAGKGWEVKSTAGNIKVQFVIDGTLTSELAGKANIQTGKPALKYKTLVPFVSLKDVLAGKLYRTVIAPANDQLEIIPIGALLPTGIENLLVLRNYPSSIKPDEQSLGQAAGGIAAFTSFFKTTTKSLDIRITQGELLGFGATLIPFKDVSVKDSNFIPLQHVALTGILKVDDSLKFNPAGTISPSEIKLAMKEYYSRSQIWFLNNNPEKLSIDDAISLLTFTATKGEELKADAEKGWKSTLKLNSNFDVKRAITRYEFAVLIDHFLRPFTVRVDLNGNLLN